MELKITSPNLKGFSVRNLKYMKSFYNEYKDDNEFEQLVAQISWKYNITLIPKVKSNKIVDYTLKYINKPVGVSEYKVFEQLNKEIQEKLVIKEDINTSLDIID